MNSEKMFFTVHVDPQYPQYDFTIMGSYELYNYIFTEPITTELPALLSLSSLFIWALFCSCMLSCKKNSFSLSISSSTQDI